jgi:two-component system OmpR family response regulator
MEKSDLYLLDNWLLGISGEELCKKLRNFDLKTPILSYSGVADDIDKARAYAAGAQGYLVKPVLGDDLVKEVTRLIAESNNEPRAQTQTSLS